MILLPRHTERPGRPDVLLLASNRPPGFRPVGGNDVYAATGGGVTAIGKGRTPQENRASAVGEWYERRHLATSTSGIIARQADLTEEFLPPSHLGLDLVRDRPSQTRAPCVNVAVRWKKMSSESGSIWVHVPRDDDPQAFYRMTSNGCAVHVSGERSRNSALTELIERDAFMRWWYNFSISTETRPKGREFESDYTNALGARWFHQFYTLPSRDSSQVVMATLWRSNPVQPTGVVIGLAASIRTGKPVAALASDALGEAIQALNVFEVNRAHGLAPQGNLSHYLNSEYALAFRQRLSSEDLQPAVLLPSLPELDGALANVYMEQEAIPGTSLVFTRVVSPNALPFALNGKGRRLLHPVLLSVLALRNRTISSLASASHPLG